MSFKIFLLILLVLFSYINGNPIKGGQDAGKSSGIYGVTGQTDFPFMAHLKISGGKTELVKECGGVIISPDTILTAAHCIKCRKSKPIISVRAGFVNFQYDWQSAQYSLAKDYVINEGYIERCDISKDLIVYSLSDIAIAWLEIPFTFGINIQKANLIKSDETFINIEGWIVGWGIDDSGKQANMLQKAQMQVISNVDCQKIYPKILVSPDMFCVISKTNSSTSCPGDSGGPFVVDNVVYGISSFTSNEKLGTCNNGKPQVFQHLGMHLEWINEMIEKRMENNNLILNTEKSYLINSDAIDLTCPKRKKED